MFAIENAKATIRSVNPRAEIHGDETRLAVDVGIEFAFSNHKLRLLDPQLLPLLYKNESSAAGQEVLDIEEGFLPNLRFPRLGKLSWDYEGAGYEFELDGNTLFDADPIVLHDCKLNKIEVECEEGGTITMRMRIQSNPTEETIGELCRFIKGDALVTLTPPQPDEEPQSDIEDDGLEEGLREAAGQAA